MKGFFFLPLKYLLKLLFLPQTSFILCSKLYVEIQIQNGAEVERGERVLDLSPPWPSVLAARVWVSRTGQLSLSYLLTFCNPDCFII